MVPIAGRSTGFLRSKFRYPRYAVRIKGITILERSLRGFGEANYYFICPQDHFKKYNLGNLILGIFPEAKILLVGDSTAGQACTAMWADSYVGNDDPLLIISPMQIINWDPVDFLAFCENTKADAAMVVCDELVTSSQLFYAQIHPEKGVIRGVTDKYFCKAGTSLKENSIMFDCGVYYFKYGQYFTRWTKDMLKRNGSVSNEFWVAFSMNDGVVEGRVIRPYVVDKAVILKRVDDVRQFAKKFPDWAKI